MKKIILIFSFISLLLIPVFSDISHVIVYKDRAMITRSQEKSSETGTNTIVFKSVSLYLKKESLRANGLAQKGSGLKILDIKTEKNYNISYSDEDGRKIEKQIDQKKDELEILKLNLDRIKKQKKNLEIFNTQTKSSSQTDLDTGKFSVKQWEEALKFYEYQSERLDKQKFDINKEIKNIKDDLKILQDKYYKYKNKYSYYSLDVHVTYQLEKQGNVKINLSYIVTNVYWYPVYDCRLDINTKELLIEYYAKVYQKTGENWNNVDLILSTARPDLSGQIPDIYPWELDFVYYEKEKDYKKSTKMYEMTKKEKYDKYEGEEKMDEEISDIDEDDSYQSTVESQGVALSYKILKKTDIPSGQDEIKVTVASNILLETQITWAMIPRQNENAFLKGKIKNNSEFTILPGNISIFVNDSFIGKSSIDLINPNQEFELSLGRDPRITAELKLDDIKKGPKLGKKFEQRRYLITITNNSSEDILLSVKDTIPKSLQPKKILVKILKIEPEPKEIVSDSIYEWEFEIKKNDKLVITQEWIVEYPEDENVTGL